MPERFPILNTGWSVPMSAVKAHERQCQANHYQTAKRLSERGGLSWMELFFVINDRPFDHAFAKTCKEADTAAAVMSHIFREGYK